MQRETMNRLAGTILQDLRSDVHSGATDITRKAVQCLTAFADEAHTTPPAFWANLVKLGRAIVEAQPSMASVFNLVNRVLLAVEPMTSHAPMDKLESVVRETSQHYIRTTESALQAIAQHGQGLITNGATVFTHSSSTTVVGILRQAARQGKSIQAIATESRPYCEGRELGRYLGQQGIPTKLILDAAIAQYVKEADVIIVGVDRISEEMFVNKVGTLTIAMTAKNENIPFYIACETGKFLPSAFTPAEPVLRSSEESDHEEWQNVQLVYSFFEEIPNHYLAGIITEDGILSLNAVSKRFKSFVICRELLPSEKIAPA